MHHPDCEWGRDKTDPNRLAAVQNTAARYFADVEGNIRSSAREAVATLERLKESDLDVEAPCRNPRWGTEPASFIVDELLTNYYCYTSKIVSVIRRNVSQYQQVRASSIQ